jgi:hypothetical protein
MESRLLDGQKTPCSHRQFASQGEISTMALGVLSHASCHCGIRIATSTSETASPLPLQPPHNLVELIETAIAHVHHTGLNVFFTTTQALAEASTR